MAVTVATLQAILSADTHDFDKAMDKSDSTMKSLAKTAGKAGLAGAIVGLGAVAKIGFDEFTQAQKVTAQTEAVLKSTGGTANVTATQIDQLAGSLLKKSGVDDEVIKSGENMLLTFTNIRNEAGKGNDIFNQATKATLDLSVATGKDMVNSSVLLGKALNDPIKGLTALTRVGVSFSEGQRDQIKAMVAAGDTMGAQKLILAELNKEFGGSAEALGKTLPGQINIAKEEFRNFAGELVAKTIPAIQSIVQWVKDNWPQIRATIAPIMQQVGEIIQTILADAQAFWDRFGGTITRVMNDIRSTILPILRVIQDAFKLFGDLLKGDWSAVWDDLKKIAVDGIHAVEAIWRAEFDIIRTIMEGLGKAALAGLQAGLSGIGDLVDKALHQVKVVFSDVQQWAHDKVDQIVGFWADMPGRIADAAKGGAQELWDGVKHIFDKLPGFIKDILDIHSPSGVFEEIGSAIIQGAIKGIEGKAGDLVSAAEGAFGGLAHKASTVAGGVASVIGGIFGGGGGANDPVSVGQRMAAGYGWGSGAEWANLYQLWQNESGWNPMARNPTSGAFGIPQALPASKMGAAAVAGNAAAQIAWGLSYIKSVYGDPINAYQTWLSRNPHWYHGGGIVPGAGDVPIVARGGEGVFTRQQMAAMGGNVTIPVAIGGDHVATIILDLARKQARVFERRNGRSAF